MSDEPEQHHLIRRLEERRTRHRGRNRVYRLAVAAVGFVVTLAGVIMLVTPGPAFVLIPIGLALLALEFVWAERLLGKAIHRAEDARRKAARATPVQKALSAAVTAAVIAAAVTAAVLWDIPLLPV